MKSRDKPARSRSQERTQRSPVARLVGTADVRSCKWSFPCVMLCDSLCLHETIGFGQSPTVPEPGKSRPACGFLKISCQNRNWSRYFRSSRPLQLGLAPLFCSPITAADWQTATRRHAYARRTGWILRRSHSIQPMWFRTRLLLGQSWPHVQLHGSCEPGKLRNSSLW